MRTRTLARGMPLRAAILAATALFFVVLGGQQLARATVEDSIVYNVSQSPAAGTVVQVGDSVSFTVDVTSAPGSFPAGLFYQVRKPVGMAFANFGTQAGNVITACTDNTPASGYVRCAIGNAAIPPNTLETGGTEIVLNFTVQQSAAGTTSSDASMQALFTDTLSGFAHPSDTPDPVGAGDTMDASVGGLTIAGANPGGNISVATGASPASLYEGALTTVTVTFTTGLPPVGPLLQPIEALVTNGDVQSGSVVCPAGGAGDVVSGVARCSGATVGNGSTMTFTVRTRDTAAGDDAVVLVTAPSLGLPQSVSASSPDGTAQLLVTVHEVGLQTVTLPSPFTPAAPPWIVNQVITVCTTNVGGDVLSDAAAGAAQGAGVAGTSTLAPVTPLALADFAVQGPSGPVSATYLDGSNANCGASQSGLTFTPAAAGSYSVTAYYNGDLTSTITNQATRGANTLTIGVQNSNPVPVLGSLSPSTKTEGSAAFQLTVTGSNFVPGAVVRWNGADRSTTYVSATQLTANISGTDLASPGTAAVSVFNPGPGGGPSGSQSFTITTAPNPVPSITTIAPNTANAGEPGFTLQVNGSGFQPASKVKWNGTDKATTYISSSQLTIDLLASDIATAGTAYVSVFTPAPGGGTSPASPFTINAGSAPRPSVSAISPTSATAGGADFTLTVTGANFAAGSKVFWNGFQRTTTFGSATSLTATITAADIAESGSGSVTVVTPAPGGGTSDPVSLAINNPAPTVASLDPASKAVGASSFTLTVTGTGFVDGSVVRWNGSDRVTTYVSSTQVTAAIVAADLNAAGTVAVTVHNPAPGGGTSSSLTFTVGGDGGTVSDQLTLTSGGDHVPRSRLTFAATSGTLNPGTLSFVIKRSDGQYWNGTAGAWQAERFENPGTVDGSSWTYAVTGTARRLFAGTSVEVEVRALKDGTTYRSTGWTAMHIR
ncbi:MAG: PASTA domain-containing protein [Dehalococcoidia bacterium]|nr:PASTA domain-containing protein [Dehalococcoidia bacterium]